MSPAGESGRRSPRWIRQRGGRRKSRGMTTTVALYVRHRPKKIKDGVEKSLATRCLNCAARLAALPGTVCQDVVQLKQAPIEAGGLGQFT